MPFSVDVEKQWGFSVNACTVCISFSHSVIWNGGIVIESWVIQWVGSSFSEYINKPMIMTVAMMMMMMIPIFQHLCQPPCGVSGSQQTQNKNRYFTIVIQKSSSYPPLKIASLAFTVHRPTCLAISENHWNNAYSTMTPQPTTSCYHGDKTSSEIFRLKWIVETNKTGLF